MAVKVPVTLSPVDTKKVDAAIARIQSQAKGVSFAGGARSLDKLSRPLGKITGQATEFKKSLDASNARVLAFGASVAVINKLSEAFAGLVSNTIKVEASFAKIGVILGGTEQQLKQFGSGIFDVAKKTATSFDQVADGALELARQGLSVEESLSRVETALKLVRVSGIDSQEAVAGLTAAIKGFEGAGINVAQIADKLAEVDTKFAVSTEDLINGLERASASARVAGVSFDELLGLITTVQERTQRGGAVIGNAFKTIFARLGRTDTLVALKDLGIEVLDAQGNVRSAVPLFQELAAELDKLGLKSVEAGEIIQKVAGVRQRDILISLVEDLNSGQSQFAKSLQVSAGAAGALDAKNEKLNQTLEALVNNVRVSAQELAALFGEIGFADAAGDILRKFSSVLGSLKDLFEGESLGSTFAKGIVKGIGGVLTGPGLALVTAIFIKLFVDLAKFGVTSLKQILGINKAAAEQKILQQSILQTLLQNENIQREILALEGNKVAQEQLLLRIYNDQAAALARVSKAAATVTPGLFGAGFRGGERGVGKTGRGAGGYIAAEARDVSRGVGGATAGSKVVSIPNFAFGRGRRGTMIANSSEYFVPNYSGGGDAIFNRDMIKTMGLPSGARKINAAGGYIPNFAAIKDPRFAMIVPSERGTQNVEGISSSKKRYQFPVVGYRDDLLEAKNDIQLKSDVEDAAIRIATLEAKTITNNDPQPTFVKKGDLNPGAVGGLAGTVFEAIVSALIKGPQFDLAKTATFDFIGADAARNLREGLFPDLSSAAEFIEAKINAGSDLRKSMADKIEKFRGGPKTLTKEGVAEIARSVAGRDLSSTSPKRDFLNNPKARAQFPGTSFARSSRGYIPNFAGGLEDAIAREEAAGIPINQIRINQNGKLRNAQNPRGLAVTNTRDEPTGRIPNFQQGGLGGGESAIDRLSNAALGASTALFFLSSAFSGSENELANFISKVAGAASVLTGLTLLSAPLNALSLKLTTFGTQLAATNIGLVGRAGGAIAGVGKALPGIGTAVAIGAVVAPLVLELTKTKTGFEELNSQLKNIDLSKLAGGDPSTIQGAIAAFEESINQLNLSSEARSEFEVEGADPKEVFNNAARAAVEAIPDIAPQDRSGDGRGEQIRNILSTALATEGIGAEGVADVLGRRGVVERDAALVVDRGAILRQPLENIPEDERDQYFQIADINIPNLITELKKELEIALVAAKAKQEAEIDTTPISPLTVPVSRMSVMLGTAGGRVGEDISQTDAIVRARETFRGAAVATRQTTAETISTNQLKALNEESELEKVNLKIANEKAKITEEIKLARLETLQALTEEAITANEAKDVDSAKLDALLRQIDGTETLTDLEDELKALGIGNIDVQKKIALAIQDGSKALKEEEKERLKLLGLTFALTEAEATRADVAREAARAVFESTRTRTFENQIEDAENAGRTQAFERELQGAVSPQRRREIKRLQQEMGLNKQLRDAKDAVAAAIDKETEAQTNLNAAKNDPALQKALDDAKDEVEQAQALLDIIKANTKAQKDFNQARSEMTGFDRGVERLEESIANFGDRLGEQIPNKFADNLGQAMIDAVSGAKDLDDALSDAGRNFLGFVRDAFLQQAAAQTASAASGLFKSVFTSIAGAFIPGGGGGGAIGTPDGSFIDPSQLGGFPQSRGGLIKGFNRGGAVGSDVVPAMLTPGEFIMSRDAVNKYGLQMLTKMNEGVMSMATMQNGGLISPAAAPVEGSSSQVNNNSEFTFNIQGGNTEQEQGGQQESLQQREFAKRIRSAVTQVVSEESRRGGSLAYLF